MFKELIITLEAVRDAINAKDSENAKAGLTIALVQIVDLFGDNENYMQQIHPMLESLRGQIRTQQFEYASETTAVILELFQDFQQTVDATAPAEPHEAAWAKEREAMHARLRTSGLKVTVAEPPDGEQSLTVTFHNSSAKKQQFSKPSRTWKSADIYPATDAMKRGEFATAVTLLKQLAGQGNTEALKTLGGIYYFGQGVEQDYVRAHMWFTLAASTCSGEDEEQAIKARNIVAAKMTDTQVSQSHEMTARCYLSNFKDCD